MGLNYDYDMSENHIYSHAKALTLHKNFNIIAGVDVLKEQRTRFKNKYNLPVFKDISSIATKNSIELAIIATPPEYHLENILSLIEFHKPKIILCEKPFADNYSNSKKIFDICKKHSIKLFINFPRRADPGIQEIKKLIQSEELSFPFKGNVWYSKGLRNNASHFLDLANFFFGEIKSLKTITPSVQSYNADFDVDFIAEYQNGSLIFRYLDYRNYNHYSFDLYFSNASINYFPNGSIDLKTSKERDLPLSFRNFLSDKPVVIEHGASKYQYHVLSEIFKEYNCGSSALCRADEALSIQEKIMDLEINYE
jgi:predicted dehydrogenase